MPSVEIVIPYRPRPLQKDLHAIWSQHRFSVAVCHRRFGKTVAAVNQLLKSTLLCRLPRPRMAYIAPTYTAGKQIAWDYIQEFARVVPGMTFNQSELRADAPNGGQLRIYSADNPDGLRGLYFDGVVLDEFGLMPPRVFSEVVRPALSDRKGWAVFLGTPAGRNQFYGIYQQARQDAAWGCSVHRASETGIIPADELDAARKDMTADEFAQEYECSFEASIKGAIYAAELAQLRHAGRVSRVPCDPLLRVDTHWDLGVGDATAIWFSQSTRSGEVRLIDYYEASGEGLPHYAKVLQDKAYLYGTHWAPHDIQVRELASGRSRLETAQSLGIAFAVVPNVPLEDGIHAARMLLPRCWVDEVRCQAGLEAMQHYRRDYNTRLSEFKATPVHDWSEHGASAFRYLAVSQQVPKDRRSDSVRPSNLGAGGWMA